VLLQIGLFAFSELNTLFLEFLEGFGYTPDEIRLPSINGWGFIGALIAVALLPAVFEEILFRGVLLGGMKQFGEVKAALLCGALFALYHQNPPQTVYQFICGTAFAFIAMRSGSILPTVLSHFLNNAFILCLYAFNVQTFPTESREETQTDARIRILQDRRIANHDVVVFANVNRVQDVLKAYEVTRAYHGKDSDSGELITDLTLQRVKP
jgi:hypothetical protein